MSYSYDEPRADRELPHGCDGVCCECGEPAPELVEGLCGVHYRAGLAARIEANVVIEPNSYCWLWTRGANSNGYGRTTVMGRDAYVHRLSHEAYVGPVPPGAEVCHRCDVPLCCNPDHLFVGTRADNMRDMAAKGRSGYQRHPHTVRRGESVNTARLTEGDVREVRRLLAIGTPQRRVAAKYGIARCAIRNIARRKAWTHVYDGECDECGAASGLWRERGRILCDGCERDADRPRPLLLMMEDVS